jgi:hypothetical protein
LIPAIVLEVDDIPRFRPDKCGKILGGHDFCLARLAIFSCGSVGQLREQPHAAERDAGAKAGGGFGDETSAAGAKDTEDFTEDGVTICHDEKKTGDDDSVDGAGCVVEGMSISVGEGTVAEAATGCARFCPSDEAAREVDAGGVDVGKFLREPAGIEAGAAPQFKNTGARGGSIGWEKSARDLLGVIAEEIFAAEGIEPGTALEETFGRAGGGRRERLPGHFAVARFHSRPSWVERALRWNPSITQINRGLKL